MSLAHDISFAFVEYESRRDADDAYHEMHNKRIGRDDLLKIEVSREQYIGIHSLTDLPKSGHGHLHLLLGVLTLAVTVDVTVLRHAVVVRLLLDVVVATILLVGTTGMTGIMTDMSVTMTVATGITSAVIVIMTVVTVTVNVLVTAREAPMRESAISKMTGSVGMMIVNDVKTSVRMDLTVKIGKVCSPVHTASPIYR